MAFRNSLFRNSFWSYQSHELVVYRLSELYTPFDATEEARPPASGSGSGSGSGSASAPVSSFSDDSDDEPRSDSFNTTRSPASQLSQASPDKWTTCREKSLPPIPRTYTIQREPRRYNVNCLSKPRRDKSWSREKAKRACEAKVKAPGDSGMSRLREVLFVFTVCMAQLCAQAGIGQTLPILRDVCATFGVANPSDLSWAVAGYCMVVGTVILVAGRLGDVFGYKNMFLVGFIWSAVWSAVVGASFYSTSSLFLISRALQGVGAGLSLPNGLALLGAVYQPGMRKAAIFTLYATMSPLGLIAGAAGASALTLVWWPLAYWAFTLVLLVVAFIGLIAIPNGIRITKRFETITAAMTELDIPGMLTGISGLVLFGFSWNQAALVGWQQPYIWIAMIAGLVMATLFVLIERYYATKPLVPFSALSPDGSWIPVALACGWSCFGIWIFYTWQFLEDFRNTSPLLSTAWFSPIAVIGCLAVITTGLMLHRFGPSIMLSISLATFTAGALLVVTMPVVQIYWIQLFVAMLVVAWGMDTSIPAAILLVSDGVEKKYHGATTSLVSAVVYYSISIGLGVAGTMENNLNNGGATRQGTLNGYRAALWTSAGFAGLGVLVSLAVSVNMYRRNRSRGCNGHGPMEGHQQI
ncbi:Uu.00g131420.m01.CDS01 [Anthostomella pinea]|uniref:Uu.00g131420.m01.CDS01 n=1 Tax=Anthostomella pinea TaxID=933095 RepID=A0AAI8VIW9_9PEZI|nr:Uu.00g131420.m01.CDS01 [Anthostomella pinea]